MHQMNEHGRSGQVTDDADSNDDTFAHQMALLEASTDDEAANQKKAQLKTTHQNTARSQAYGGHQSVAVAYPINSDQWRHRCRNTGKKSHPDDQTL